MDEASAAGPIRVLTRPSGAWLWAPDAVTERQLPNALDRAGLWWRPARHHGQRVPLVTDVDFGISSYATCVILTGAGFSFSWHEDQPPDRRDDIWATTTPKRKSPHSRNGRRAALPSPHAVLAAPWGCTTRTD